jgi:osmoprotectant transport system substrate-binding protein
MITAGGFGSLLILGFAAGGALSAGSGTSLTIADKGFPESQIFAQLYAKALEAKGYSVKVTSLGSSAVADAAIRKGSIDVYPEYTGTALRDILKKNVKGSPAQQFAFIKAAYARRGLTALNPAPFNNGNEVACTEAAIRKYKITSLGSLAKAAPKLTYSANAEHLTRPDGYPLLKSRYGINFSNIITVAINLRYQPVDQGSAQCVYAFETDPQVQPGNKDHLVILKDNKNLFQGGFQSFPVVSTKYFKTAPKSFAPTLNRVSSLIKDGRTASLLINQVQSQHKDPDQVAEAFLKAKGVVK